MEGSQQVVVLLIYVCLASFCFVELLQFTVWSFPRGTRDSVYPTAVLSVYIYRLYNRNHLCLRLVEKDIIILI